MKLGMNEAIAQAIDTGNARLAGIIADKLRMHGFTYARVLARVREHRPNVSDAQWEDLMCEADALASQ